MDLLGLIAGNELVEPADALEAMRILGPVV